MRTPGRCTASRHERGFTLVELLVVLAIITLLITIGLSSYSELMKRSRDTKRETDLKVIQSALQQYYADRGIYPTAIGTELNINTGAGDRTPVSPTRVYLSQIPSEPPPAASPYCYEAQPAGRSPCNNNVTATPCTSYKLFAKLESLTGTLSCGLGTTYNRVVTPP